MVAGGRAGWEVRAIRFAKGLRQVSSLWNTHSAAQLLLLRLAYARDPEAQILRGRRDRRGAAAGDWSIMVPARGRDVLLSRIRPYSTSASVLSSAQGSISSVCDDGARLPRVVRHN